MRDVVVVGGGPAGLYAALLAAEGGLDVLVLEEHPEIGLPTHCTGIVSGETNGLYKFPGEVVLDRPSSCLVISPGGRVACLRDPGEEIAVLDRAAFDQALAAEVLRAGGVVRTNYRVDCIRNDDRFVEVQTNHGECLRARALVLGCGVTFRFHALLGSRLPSPILHTAQMEVAAAPGDALEVHVGRHLAPEGFAWLVPFHRCGAAYVKAGVLVRGNASAYLERFLTRPAVASRLQAIAPPPVRRLLPLGPVGRSFANRVVAVGDAAGLTKPVSGGGIFYSLLSAQFAAETLIEALADDDLSADRLCQYETRWRERLMTEIRISTWFRCRLAGLTDHEWDKLVAALASDDVQAIIKRNARFNWHSPLILSLIKQPGLGSIFLRSLFR